MMITEDQIQYDLKTKLSESLKIDKMMLDEGSSLYAFGIDSLIIADIQSYIFQKWKVDVPFEKLLEDISLKKLSDIIKQDVIHRSQENTSQNLIPFSQFPLSYQQKGIWLASQVSPVSHLYNVARVFEICQALDLTRFKEALEQIIQNHSLLRTSFHFEDNQLYQKVHPFHSLENYFSYSEKVNCDTHSLPHFFNAESQQKFQLDTPYLLKIYLIKIQPTKYLLFLVAHHLIVDLWSFGLFLSDLFSLYCKELNHFSQSPSYVEYVDWQHKHLESQEKYSLKNWMDQYQSVPLLTTLPSDFPRPHQKNYRGNHHSFIIPFALTEQIKEFNRIHHLTPLVTFISAFFLLIHYFSRQNTLCLGTTTNGRNSTKWNEMFGCFSNPIPLLCQVETHETFLEFVRKIKQSILEGYSHSTIPFNFLVEQLDLSRETSYHPLFQTMFVYQQVLSTGKELAPIIVSHPQRSEMMIGDIPVASYYWNTPISLFDLTLFMNETQGSFRGSFEYDTDLYKPETISDLENHFLKLLEECISSPHQRIDAFDIRNEQEILQTLSISNSSPFDFSKTLGMMFVEKVQNSPHHIVLQYGEQCFSYLTVEQYSNQMAHLLMGYGVKPGSLIALNLKHSPLLIFSILAILKLGAGFLPLDPKTPSKRIHSILEESGAKLLISDSHQAFEKEFSSLSITQDFWNNLLKQSSCAIKEFHNSQAIAYVIYTSGSTGKPKGVAISHRMLLNYLLSIQKRYQMEDSLHFPLYSSLAFDLTMTSLFLPLLFKHTMHIFEDTGDLAELLEQIFCHPQMTHVKLTPAHLQLLLDIPLQNSNVRQLIVGGEQLSLDLANLIYNKFNQRIVIINEYGPTEATIGCIYFPFPSVVFTGNTIPIGSPIDHTRAYIVNHVYQKLPNHAVGELALSGECLSYGYWKRPELTAEKFLPDPDFYSERMYLTGDVAQIRDRALFYSFGRTDRQLKIRGFRIELDEIEAAIKRHPDIKDCIVTVLEFNNTKFICAYIVYHNFLVQENSTLLNFLTDLLPSYMIPSYIISCLSIPLTSNGKVDYKALPKPQPEKQESHYKPPISKTETQLVNIWAKVLGYSPSFISVDHHFFALGGDSIKAIQIVSISRNCGIHLTSKDIFEHPTIRQLASIHKREEKRFIPKTTQGSYSLSPIQKWFFKNFGKNPHHYNQAFYIIYSSSFDLSSLLQAIEAILNNHPVFQSQFLPETNQVMMPNNAIDKLYQLEIFDMTSEKENVDKKIQEKLKKLHRQINFNHGPLLSFGLFRLHNHDILVPVIHHLVIDGVSWRLLLEEFEIAYQQSISNVKINLPKEITTYEEWVDSLIDYANSSSILSELLYWKSFEEKGENIIDPKRYIVKEQKTQTTYFSIELTQALLKNIHQAFHTQINDILLSAFKIALGTLYQCEEVLIHLELHGREEINANHDITQTVGWFTSLVPLFLPLTCDNDIKNLIRQTKELLRSIPSKGFHYQILSHLSNENPLKNIQPSIIFNYLGELPQSNSHFNAVPIFHDLIDDHLLTPYQLQVNCIIINGCLQIHCTYDGSSFSNPKIIDFLNSFKESLQSIIQFCLTSPIPQKTPSDFDDSDLTLQNYDQLLQQISLPMTEIEVISPITAMQEGILYHSQSHPHSPTYFEQALLEFEGKIDIDHFRSAFAALISYHPILRTAFYWKGLSTPRQVTFAHVSLAFEVIDLSSYNSIQQRDLIDQMKSNDIHTSFNLSVPPLMRIKIVSLGNHKHLLIWSFHHLILDGWSLSILFRQLINQLKGKSLPSLKNTQSPLKSYVKWVSQQNKEKAKEYWFAQLKEYDKILQFDFLKKATSSSEVLMKEVIFSLDEQLLISLSQLTAKFHTTLSVLWHVIWGFLLMNYHNMHDVVFGSVFSGRNTPIDDIEHLVGMFIQTLPIRIKSLPNQTFTDLLSETHKQLMASEEYAYLPLTDIQSCSPLKSNLISTLLIIENYPFSGEASAYVAQNDLPFHLKSAHLNEETPYKFSITILPGKCTSIKLQYNASEYEEEKVLKIKEHFLQLLDEVLINPNLKMGILNFLTEPEQNKLIREFNTTEKFIPQGKTIHAIFEEQVQKAPHSIALINDHVTLTYQELNRRANQLACYLINLGIQAESLVGIYIDRCPERLIAWLAIMKAGGTYVPLDPSIPLERLSHIIENTQLTLLLTLEKFHSLLNKRFENLKIINCDNDFNLLKFHSHGNVKAHVAPANIAYILYTSGSTGKPKGIAVEHRAVINHLHWICRQFGLNGLDRMLHMTSFSFDVSLCEFYALLVGGTLILAPEAATRDILELEKTIKKHRVTFIQLTPALLNAMSHQGFASSMQSVRQVLCGADILQSKHLKEWFSTTSIPLANLYGLTETCIDATFFECTPSMTLDTIPIGKPLDNMQAYIFDEYLNLLPLTIKGHLFLSGKGLARGYFNQPALTAERFLPHPYLKGKRIYKTGDLASWSAEGNLHYFGRLDNQIKIRGMRIELAEIEQTLLQHPAVKDAVLKVVGQDQNKSLHAYVQCVSEVPAETLRQFLVAQLPHYMVPSTIQIMDKFPFTSNGKIDKEALPSPLHIQNQIIAPLNELQKQLTHIWATVLKLKDNNLSIDQNFFDLGGNSISLMHAHSLICHHFKIQIPIESLFQYSTIRALSQALEKQNQPILVLEKAQNQTKKQRDYYSNLRKNISKI